MTVTPQSARMGLWCLHLESPTFRLGTKMSLKRILGLGTVLIVVRGVRGTSYCNAAGVGKATGVDVSTYQAPR